MAGARLATKKRFMVVPVLLLALLLAVPILALSPTLPPADEPAFAQGIPWVGNTVKAHDVWDPDPSREDWVTGHPKGYTEGETAAFRVRFGSDSSPLPAGQPFKFQLCLDFDDSGAYAFINLESWDTTYQQDGTHLTPPPLSGNLTGDVNGVNAYNAIIDNVTFLGEGGGLCSGNYLSWEVSFTVNNSGIVYIIYGGHIAAPGDPLPSPPGGTVPNGESASSCTGVFQARIASEGAGDKTVNFSPALIKPLVATVSGYKYEDMDGDGDISEDTGNPLAGWEIHLDGTDGAGNPVALSTTTDGSGYYKFSVAPGSYIVSEVLQTGWTQSYPAAPGIHDITLTSGEVFENNNFGNFQYADVTVCKVDTEGNPVPGWEVYVDDQSNVTGADGCVTFTLTQPGDYTVTEESRSNWTPMGPTSYDFTAVSGGSYGLFIFTNFQNADVTVCKVDTEGNPVPGWEVYVNGQTDVTGVDGCVTFTLTQPGDYTVTEESRSNWTPMGPTSYDFTAVSGGSYGPFIFTNFQNADVTVCKEDPDGNRLNGWTINLFDASGVEIAEGVTGVDGCVTFALQPGDYSLTEDLQSCWIQLEPTSGSFVFTATSGYQETFTFVNTPTIITVNVDNTGPVCEGESVQLLLLDISGGTPDYTYSWSGPGFSSTQPEPTISPAVAGTYTLTVTDAEGCTSDTASTIVVVYPDPDCTIATRSAVSPGSTNTVSVPNAGAGATYAWTISGPGTINSVLPYSNSITWTANAVGTVTIGVTITTANGCESTCSRPVTVMISPPPCRPEIQLAVLIDGSSTMDDPGEWDTQINGLYNAILDPDCIPDCFVELTVIQFAGDLAGGARTEVSNIVITDDNRYEVAQDVLDTVKSSGITTMEAGIDRAVEVLRSSPNFDLAKQIINISSDVQENTLNRAAVEEARDNAISAGIDEISAEGVGDFRIPQDQDWLTSEILYPQPGNVAPVSWQPGWVYAVGTDAGKFKEAICHKIGFINHVPVAVDDAYSTKENTTLNVAAPGVLANDYDADGDPLTAILVSDVSHGTLTLNADGSFSYIPVADFNGSDSFTYKANDGIADSNVATVSITVTSVSPGPGPLDYIVIAPETANITTGDTQPYTAYAYDALDNYIGNVTSETTFSIEAGAGGGWADNVYTSDNVGTWTVNGLYEGKADTAILTVNAGSGPGNVSYIVIDTDTPSITAGRTAEYTAEAFDSLDSSLGDVTSETNFSIEAGAGGSWAGNVYTSDNVGTWTVNGTYLSFYDTASLRVRSSGGGGGGGGGVTTQTFTVIWDGETTTASMTTSGMLLGSLSAPSPDGLSVLEIKAGTIVLDSNGNVITLIEITGATIEPPLPNTELLGSAFTISPSDTHFSRLVTLTAGYPITDLPDETLAVRMVSYSSEEGWQDLEAESTEIADLGYLILMTENLPYFTLLAVLPSFEVSELSITPSRHEIWGFPTFTAREGEEALITATVTNTGDQEATKAVSLLLNGEIVDSQVITLDAGQSKQVEFAISDIETGDYEIALGDQSTEFESFFWINWLLIGIISVALVLLALLVGRWYAKRKKTAQQPAE